MSLKYVTILKNKLVLLKPMHECIIIKNMQVFNDNVHCVYVFANCFFDNMVERPPLPEGIIVYQSQYLI